MCSLTSWRKTLLLLAYLTLIINTTNSLDNGVGLRPAMGWNSWNFFRCDINETLIRQVADAIASSGLKAAGYEYVVIDDCWQQKRGPDQRIIPFQSKFPSGMKALADYIHSKGLKFGIYSDAGNHTCEGYPGSFKFEKIDAASYAEWGVDYLKYDYCATEGITLSVRANYERMRDALNATGRPILYSLCSWGMGQPHLWGKDVAHQWRTGIDVFATWDKTSRDELALPDFLQSILSAVDHQEALHSFAGPGGFNDPDMLVVGLDGMYPYGLVQRCPSHIPNCKRGEYISRERWGKVGGLTRTQQMSHFSLWCMLASPLILGNDPRHMDKHTLKILTAPEIIAINQEPLGKQARRSWQGDGVEVWSKELMGDRAAVMMLNRGDAVVNITTVFRREVPALAAKWAREVPKVIISCVDKHEACALWASRGECVRNPGFMLFECQASCPNACPTPPPPSGPLATAMIRDAWMEEDLGQATGEYNARNLGPHESRVLVLSFIEAGQQGTEDQMKQHATNGRSVSEHSQEHKTATRPSGGLCLSMAMVVTLLAMQGASVVLILYLMLHHRARRAVKVL